MDPDPLDALAADLRQRLLADVEADAARAAPPGGGAHGPPDDRDLPARIRALVDARAGPLAADGRARLAERVAELAARFDSDPRLA